MEIVLFSNSILTLLFQQRLLFIVPFLLCHIKIIRMQIIVKDWKCAVSFTGTVVLNEIHDVEVIMLDTRQLSFNIIISKSYLCYWKYREIQKFISTVRPVISLWPILIMAYLRTYSSLYWYINHNKTTIIFSWNQSVMAELHTHTHTHIIYPTSE